jgi:hypothetical protein
MLSQDEVFQYLLGLPDTDYTDIVFRTESTRQGRVNDVLAEEAPAGAPDRDTVASWLARKHLAIDPGIAEIYYLPAPAIEIRFIEVNRLLPIADPPDRQFRFIDFGLDIDGLDFSLFVIDMTLDQWQKVPAGEFRLPEGWAFEPHTVFRREA